MTDGVVETAVLVRGVGDEDGIQLLKAQIVQGVANAPTGEGKDGDLQTAASDLHKHRLSACSHGNSGAHFLNKTPLQQLFDQSGNGGGA